MRENPACLIPASVWARMTYFRRTTRVLEFLDQNRGVGLSLGQAAKLACMERTAFSRFFRQRIGVTFSQFRRAYRVELAIREMTRNNSSVKEIAHSVGFNCVATFERQFRKELGVSPSLFRSRVLRDPELLAGSGVRAAAR